MDIDIDMGDEDEDDGCGEMSEIRFMMMMITIIQ